MSEEVVIHGGHARTRVVPLPGEIWLRDADEVPVIIVSLTLGRVTFVMPTTGGDSNAEKPYRESYCGSDYFFAEEWTRMWPPITRNTAAPDPIPYVSPPWSRADGSES